MGARGSDASRREEVAGRGGPSRVLVVDDNRLNRLKLARAVEQQGHVAGMAENGVEALEKLASEPFDLVLLDVVMPEMDGFEVLHRLKCDPDLRDLPVIVVSAVDDMDSVVRCIELGAEDYLPKPFDPLLLRARLGTSLERKRLRDLERAYLEQELALRQSEKLATMGRLSAGLAHELNNPAAAALRSAEQARSALGELEAAHLALHGRPLTGAQRERLAELERAAREAASRPPTLDALARSDLEADLGDWLAGEGVNGSWSVAASLAALGSGVEELTARFDVFEPGDIPVVAAWLGATLSLHTLLEELRQGTRRISELVEALKAYTFMDRAPVQEIDVHQGIDDTLIMMRPLLDDSIVVRREFDADAPRITAFGSELNQVWTNLIANAADAVRGNGGGEIVIRTRRENGGIRVSVQDNGSGIDEPTQAHIFDPFFTTKPPGEGAGLGLFISHSIVVRRHGGHLTVRSSPGSTTFEVRLPARPSPNEAGAAGAARG